MCRIVQNTEASVYIFWYHDNRMINYDADRGINVSTEAGNWLKMSILVRLFRAAHIHCLPLQRMGIDNEFGPDCCIQYHALSHPLFSTNLTPLSILSHSLSLCFVKPILDFHYSELTITHTKKQHSGNYSCVPSNVHPAFVLVHIFKGEFIGWLNRCAIVCECVSGAYILSDIVARASCFRYANIHFQIV